MNEAKAKTLRRFIRAKAWPRKAAEAKRFHNLGTLRNEACPEYQRAKELVK